MAKITDLSTLSKTSATTNDYTLVANAATASNKKIRITDLFPTLTTVGTGGQNLYVDVASKNNLRFKGIIAADTKVSISTVSDNIQVGINEANIDLSNCDNSTSAFLTSVGLTTSVTGTLPVANGGTNATSFLDKAVVITQDSGTDTLSSVAMSTNGQLLIGGTSGPSVATLTAGTNVTVTNGDGTIEIAAALSSISSTLDMNNNNIDLGTGWLSADGTSNGAKVVGNNLYVGPSASAFDSSTLNLAGGISFLTNTAHTIEPVSGTTPQPLSIKGQSTTTTNGAGGGLNLYGGNGDGSGNGGGISIYGGESASGLNGKINFYAYNNSSYDLILSIGNSGSKDLGVSADITFTNAGEGLTAPSGVLRAVTQATDHTTGVTLNATFGIITLAGVALNAAAEAEFTITNSAVDTDSIILLTVQSPAAASATDNATMIAQISALASGSFNIRLTNPGAGNTSTNAHKIHFMVIK